MDIVQEVLLVLVWIYLLDHVATYSYCKLQIYKDKKYGDLMEDKPQYTDADVSNYKFPKKQVKVLFHLYKGWSAVLEAYAKQFNITKLKRIITGGATGQESIYNGLKAIKEDNEETKDIVVVIHDGNRPMLPQDVITDNLVKQKLFGSAVTVIPTTEVVFVSKDGVESNAALNREELWRTQTPHSYRFDELWTVHNQAIKDGVTNMAASCSLMQKYGYTTYFSKGSEKNIKITTVEDIEIFKALLSAKNDEWIKK